MANVISLYRSLEGFGVEDYGGSRVARLVRQDGKLVEVGVQRCGRWLPRFPGAKAFGVTLGLPAARQIIITQHQVYETSSDNPTVTNAVPSEAHVTAIDHTTVPWPTTAEFFIGEAALGRQLHSIVDGARVLNTREATAYMELAMGLAPDAAEKEGLAVYNRPAPSGSYLSLGALAI